MVIKSIIEIYDEINIDFKRDYLSKGKCVELNQVLQTSRNETFIKLVEDETMKYAFFWMFSRISIWKSL